MAKTRTLQWVSTLALLLVASTSYAQTTTGNSQNVTWNCTGTNCPWGSSTSGRALVWPASMGAVANRLGYTVTAAIYLPAAAANGAKVKVTSGSAEFYAGAPDASSHHGLNALAAGDSWIVSDVAPGEVLSVQSSYDFSYEVTPAAAPPPPPPPPPPPGGGSGSTGASQSVTWNCTGTNCPWGNPLSGIALVWPNGMGATAARLGYTVSKAIYLPASVANTITVKITGGSASLYAGQPNDSSHRGLMTLSVGETYNVSGLASGEVLSVQSSTGFQFELTTHATTPPPPPPDANHTSQQVTWSCTGDPCPWGSSTSGQALVWPASAGATSARLGYTTSSPIYLTSAHANGTTVKVNTGSVTLYAGIPGATSHRAIMSIAAGDPTYTVVGVAPGEVLSVQSSSSFTYDTTIGNGSDPGGGGGGAGSGPGHNGINDSELAYWRCNVPSCVSSDWVGAVIHWPQGTAYSSNGRTGDYSRTVYNSSGQVLYPYMGRWAEGCKVTAESGIVVIIEWERGTNEWRETTLQAGQSHTIHLVGSENGAMIETTDFSPGFSVLLSNCNPKPLP